MKIMSKDQVWKSIFFFQNERTKKVFSSLIQDGK